MSTKEIQNDSDISELLLQALREPADSRSYWLDRRLREIFPDRTVLQATGFDFLKHAEAEAYEVKTRDGIHSEVLTNYYPAYGIYRTEAQTWRIAGWQNNRLELIRLAWTTQYCEVSFTWILADSTETAEAYLATVSQWNAEVRGEILVFEGGQWGKSTELFDSIQSASFENLVLPPVLKAEIQRDFGAFFESRQDFERFGVPWKRGVLFHGLPGNGKTHTLKALINWLKVPCLYVKSFKGNRYESEHGLIHRVFERARTTTPCLLVLEDLDSLVDDGNRSFFLNELDGFASNTGIVIVATTNHPERLDPAILNRPSRFDRKYQFALPEIAERSAYLSMWSKKSEIALQLSSEDLATISQITDGFSFAYLKELWLSSMMRWMESQEEGKMGATMTEQVHLLREQMSEALSEPAPSLDIPPGEDAD